MEVGSKWSIRKGSVCKTKNSNNSTFHFFLHYRFAYSLEFWNIYLDLNQELLPNEELNSRLCYPCRFRHRQTYHCRGFPPCRSLLKSARCRNSCPLATTKQLTQIKEIIARPTLVMKIVKIYIFAKIKDTWPDPVSAGHFCSDFYTAVGETERAVSDQSGWLDRVDDVSIESPFTVLFVTMF